MIASKVIYDDTYSNKSWSIVAQGMFSLRKINQMEREMCSYLEWELTVDNPILSNFETMVKRDFPQSGPYPTYSLQMVSKKANTSPPHSTHFATSDSRYAIDMYIDDNLAKFDVDLSTQIVSEASSIYLL